MVQFVADVEVSFSLEEINLLNKVCTSKNVDIGSFVRTSVIQKAEELLEENGDSGGFNTT